MVCLACGFEADVWFMEGERTIRFNLAALREKCQAVPFPDNPVNCPNLMACAAARGHQGIGSRSGSRCGTVFLLDH